MPHITIPLTEGPRLLLLAFDPCSVARILIGRKINDSSSNPFIAAIGGEFEGKEKSKEDSEGPAQAEEVKEEHKGALKRVRWLKSVRGATREEALLNLGS